MAFADDLKSKARLKAWCKRLIDDGYNVEYYHSIWLKDSDGVFRGKKDKEMAQKVDMLVVNKKFTTRGALANKAIDNGIDLKDLELKHIILLNQYDHVQIQQMVGRKRFDIHNPNDRLTVWFTTENNGVLENSYQRLAQQVKLINEYSVYRHENLEATKVGLQYLPINKDKSTEELTKMAEGILIDTFSEIVSFIEVDEETKEMTNLEIMEKNMLPKELINNDEYAGLLRYQLGYIAPLVRKYLVDKQKDDGSFETVEKQNIVRNYQELVKDLFNRPSEIQWRNKDEAKDEITKLQEQRVAEELIPYLQGLEGVKLFDDEKREFQSKISYYYGASKRSSRLAGLTTTKEFIGAHGFTISDKRLTINQKKRTVWIVEQI